MSAYFSSKNVFLLSVREKELSRRPNMHSHLSRYISIISHYIYYVYIVDIVRVTYFSFVYTYPYFSPPVRIVGEF